MTDNKCPHDMGSLLRQEDGYKIILCLMCGEEYDEENYKNDKIKMFDLIGDKQ